MSSKQAREVKQASKRKFALVIAGAVEPQVVAPKVDISTPPRKCVGQEACPFAVSVPGAGRLTLP